MKRADVVAWLEQRVRADEDCLLWVMAVNGAGTPVASVDGLRARNVRRWLYEQLVGPLDAQEKVLPKCRNRRCLARQHFAVLVPAQVNALISAEGGYNTPARVLAQQRVGRSCSPNTMADAERARQLRAEGKVLREIAEATGMSLSVTSRVCRGERWSSVAPAASVFTWRGAA